MKKIFKNLFLISFLSLLILAPLHFANATASQDIAKQLKAAAVQGAGFSEKQKTPADIVVGIVKVGLSLVGTVFLVLTIYAGVLWMTAGGNDEQVTQAKKTMIRSFIGLVIVISSYSISLFAERLIKGDNDASYCIKTPSGDTCCKGEPCWESSQGFDGIK